MQSSLIHRYSAYVILPCITFILSLILTKIAIKLLPKLGFLDIPGGRHIHTRITPKAGGIAIITAFLLSWFFFFKGPWSYFKGTMTLVILNRLMLPILLLVILGLIDDRFNIRARYKLLGQLIVGFISWYMGFGFDHIFNIQLNSIISAIFTTLWIVAFINAFNLIDGLDGLAAGIAIVSSICMAVIFIFQHQPMNTVIIFCLAAACLGFLRYNFYPAKIFMGDTGSMFLGFMLAVTGIITSENTATFSAVFVPILAAGVPVFDTFLAVWRRIVKKVLYNQSNNNGSDARTAAVMEGDREHIHHRLLEHNKSQKKATLVMYGISIIFAIIAISIVVLKDKITGLGFILVLISFGAAIRYLATIELWSSTKALLHTLRTPKKNLFLALILPVFDIAVIMLSYIGIYLLFFDFKYSAGTVTNLLRLTFYNALPIVIILHLCRVYRRFWFRASSQDYIYLAKLLVIAHVINAAIAYFCCCPDNFKIFSAQYLLFFLSTSALIVGQRMSYRFLSSIFFKNLFISVNKGKNIPRALIYGGGIRCRFFIIEKNHNIEHDPVEIIGIIDDLNILRNQYVYGYKVLGGIDDIEYIYEKSPFDRLILATSKIDLEKKKIAVDFCRKHNIRLTELQFEEKEL